MATEKPKTSKAAPKAAASTPQATNGGPANGLAIAALVVGIIALVSGWAPFWGFIVGATAIVLGVIGLKKPGYKGMSIAGIVMGGVGALWSLVISLLFLVSIFTVGLGGAVATGALNEAAQKAQSSLDKYNSETQALINAKKDYKKGETATFGQFEVKVNSVSRSYSPKNSYLTAGDGKEFIVVNVTAKNVGEESKYISSYDLKLNEAGVTNTASYFDVDPSFDGGTLSPKASLTGNLMFEVTKSASNLKLQYETTVYDSEGSGLKTLTYTLEI